MSLTIEDIVKAFKLGKFQDMDGGNFIDADMGDYYISEFLKEAEAGNIRIKPEPREYWLCDGNIYGSKDSADRAIHGSKLMCGSLGLTIESFTHVKEVL